MRVLQTLALPLGHVTIFGATVAAPFGAADEARTRYLHLGKVALYQMSYGRILETLLGLLTGASDRNRTNDTGIFSPLLYRLSYRGIGAISACAEMAATRIGLEPTTPSVTGWCSNQLSYRAMIAQVHRFWRLTAGTCVIIPEKRAVVKHEFQKMSKKFGKV